MKQNLVFFHPSSLIPHPLPSDSVIYRHPIQLVRTPVRRVKSLATPHPRTEPVPITAVCPECQNHFRLQEAMVSKSMRCPVCQEVFVVQPAPAGGPPPADMEKAPPAAGPPRTRTDAPPVVSRSGNVTDFVPVLTDVSAVRPAQPPA